MVPTLTVAASQDIVDSLSPVELAAESESAQATYDNARDSTSLAVVAVVAAARGEDMGDLPPLHAAIDTDALDELMMDSVTGPRGCDSISFRYDELDITVTREGVIEANPIESAKSP